MTPTSRTTAGQALSALRKRRGLTGRALAERTGVSQPSVARAEAGRIRLPPGALERLLRELEPTQQERWTIVAGMAWDHAYTRLL